MKLHGYNERKVMTHKGEMCMITSSREVLILFSILLFMLAWAGYRMSFEKERGL